MATTSCGARRATATTSSGARPRDGDNIVWGTARGDDNIVWGTSCGGGDCDNIVWGTARDGDNIVWGTARDGDNIVWGTAGADGDNIVWGTARGDDNIVWGTLADGDNIVWGTAVDGDNIVWGTRGDGDNIVWGTESGGDNIVWGTAADGSQVLWDQATNTPIDWTTMGSLFPRLSDEQIFYVMGVLATLPTAPTPTTPGPIDLPLGTTGGPGRTGSRAADARSDSHASDDGGSIPCRSLPACRTVDACAGSLLMEKMPYQPGVEHLELAIDLDRQRSRSDWQRALPTLHGEQVVLRDLRSSDAASLFALLTTEEVSRFISPPPTDVEGFERFIAWAQRQRTRGHVRLLRGHVEGLRHGDRHLPGPPAGFELRPRRMGFCDRLGVLGHAASFRTAPNSCSTSSSTTLGVRRLEARAAVANGRGNGALVKIGAVQEAVLRKSFLRDGQLLDQVLYSVIAEDRRATRGPLDGARTRGPSVRVH